MRITLVSTFLVLLLFGPTQGQTSRTRGNPSTQSWQQFISVFRAAARARDRQVLRTMMTRDFEWAGDGKVGPDEALSNLDQGLVTWKKFIQSVNGRVVTCKLNDSSCWNFNGRQAKRTTGPEWLVFELGADGRWRWARLVGD
jgi:hypothetical protein